jgi:hypothetical protein
MVSNLAGLYKTQGRYEEAKDLHDRTKRLKASQ